MIGRVLERKSLMRAVESDESQFVAVYGRRRIGKTYLVRETLGKMFCFEHSGIFGETFAGELSAFRDSLIDSGLKDCPELSSWTQAFRELRRVIDASRQKRKVVFIDEMPWMDTPKSGFVSALDHFWNQWASARKDVVLVICGSATSWIIDKVIKDRGGLHNRVTDTIELLPFTLRECEEYAASKRLSMSRKEIAETYMVLGGVPYYWSFFVRELDPVQNVDALCFARGGKLRDEFTKLYRSLFKNDEGHYKIIEALGRKKAGMSREEILKTTGLLDGGTLTKNLAELDQCGFIRRYTAPGKKKKDAIYQLFDNFTLFYFKFMEGESNPDPNFWQKTSVTQRAAVWKGLAFERVCLLHVEQIKKALGISGILTRVFGWQHDADDTYPQGAQIDLLIERGDSAYNVCEMKFSDERYVIKKRYAEDLRTKVGVFRDLAAHGKTVYLTLVTTFGLARNAYANSVQSEVTLDDLFRA